MESDSDMSPPPPAIGHAVGSHVAALSSWDACYHPAKIVDQRQSKAGVEFYVHYLEYNKRLDEWLPSTRVNSGNPEAGLLCKSSVSEGSASLAGSSPFTPGENKAEASGSGDRKLTRNLKRRYDEIHSVQKAVEDLAPLDQTLEKEHEEKTKVKNIQVVELGRYEIDAWYYSPYPEEYAAERKLYVCEFCLKYMKKKLSLQHHKANCVEIHPPGDQIYCTTARSDPLDAHSEEAQDFTTDASVRLSSDKSTSQILAMYEVDGSKSKIYCQNLCLLAKLFLDHKTLYYDVESFLFYVLAERRGASYHLVGYFSKEKYSIEDYNLACILTLPPFQRKGYGRFLISFAYELSKKEGKVGTPERPLSDLGQVSFRSYWSQVLLEILRDCGGNLSIKDLSNMTAIRNDDIVSTLHSLNLIKYWKGQPLISASPKIVEEHMKTVITQPNWSIDPSRLHWTPLSYVAVKRPR